MDFDRKKVLVIDDDPNDVIFICNLLEKYGFEVYTAGNGNDGIELAEVKKPDLIILDVMLPGVDGIETCKEIRERPQFNDTLITFLTARSEDYSQIAGFEAGADEYIIKPIRPNLLLARISALLKRSAGFSIEQSILNTGCFKIDLEKRLVYLKDKRIELPKKEFELLMLLTSVLGKVFTREQIYQRLWPSDNSVGDRTIDVYVRKLRRKIGNDCIKTLKGVGYKYNEYCSTEN